MSERVYVLAVLRDEYVALIALADMVHPSKREEFRDRADKVHEARAAVAELIEENKRLKAKADRWDDLIAARNQTAAEPDDAEWKRVAREESFLKGIAACRAAHGYSLREARECVEAYLASVRPGRVGGAP